MGTDPLKSGHKLCQCSDQMREGGLAKSDKKWPGSAALYRGHLNAENNWQGCMDAENAVKNEGIRKANDDHYWQKG